MAGGETPTESNESSMPELDRGLASHPVELLVLIHRIAVAAGQAHGDIPAYELAMAARRERGNHSPAEPFLAPARVEIAVISADRPGSGT
jgi:hypothetical protein